MDKDKIWELFQEYDAKRNRACTESDIFERESLMNQILADLLHELSKASR